MQVVDYVVLVGYFVVLIALGVISSLRIKKQEDFFMGGRSFGKLLQTFAAFGAGTGSSDPVNTGRTTFTSGLSGMWSVMYWLFVTPFYWITGVWYRRMRHLTLGDWFVERYESKAMGAGYCFFGIAFFMVYGSMMFSAIGKVAAPLIGFETFQLAGQTYEIEYMLVPVIGVVVLMYGILGGLRAAYFTDLIQGICIILLSIILIPYGLDALVTKFDPEGTRGLLHGFRVMHEQLPEDKFTVVGSSTTSDFPLHRIIAVVIINLVGIVVQPHFIATGGGSAKTETNARVGLVVGNFLKRFCTVGWVLTALIVLTLFADQPEKIEDPDKVWGLATVEILGPLNVGLVGLMLACLLAALMSSVDAYMIVGSGLMVRNLYAPYINADASEKQYVLVARMTGVIVVGGAVLISLFMMDVFEQLQLTWVFGVLFAAPFWVGMYWRRATTTAAWVTVAFCALMFFVVPFLAPRVAPSLRTNENFLTTNQIVEITTTRNAAPSDVAARAASIEAWDEAHEKYQAIEDPDDREEKLKALGERPQPLKIGDTVETETITGGQSVFWGSGVKPVDEDGNVLEDVKPRPVGEPEKISDSATQVVLAYEDDVSLKGFGNFKLDFLLYQLAGLDLTTKTNATLSTLELPVKIVSPFFVMIIVSLVTRRNSKDTLDRYYAKMKTPVDPDPDVDHKNLEAAFQDPGQFESRKLLPGTSLEFSKPTVADVVGFVICFLACFAIIGLAILVASIGG